MALEAKKSKVISKADEEGPNMPSNGSNVVDPTVPKVAEGNVEQHHPDYDENLPDWKLVRDAIKGDRTVKDQGETYLPMPDGFTMMDDAGTKAYQAYKTRAQFPRVVEPTLRGMLGIIHRKEADIKMPKAMEYLWEKATKDGITLEGFHRRITHELLTTGRYGVFVDMSSTGLGDPWLCGYDAEHLINWSEFNDFFVLDETRDVRQGFSWMPTKKFRVLEMVPTNDGEDPEDPNTEKFYRVRVLDNNNTSMENASTFEPTLRGGGQWDEIPFVTIGSTDVMVTVDEVPLLAVAQGSFATYRLDADYRHQLHMSGQETFVCTGINAADRPRVVGAGVVLTLPEGCDAKYASPTCKGIEAHAAAIDSELEKGAAAGARMFSAKNSKTAESGEALKIRVAGETATITSIAISSAAGLERALKKVAKYMNLKEEDVSVTPNLSFVETTLTPGDAMGLVRIWQANVISKQTVYEALQRGEIASTERSYEDEQALLEDEMPPPGSDPMGINAAAPNDAQLNAFRNGQVLPSNGKLPPKAGRPGFPNKKAPPGAAPGFPASNKGKVPSKKAA